MTDKWLRLIGIPIVTLLAFFVYEFESWDQLGWVTLFHLFVSLVFTTVIWYGNRFIWFKFQRLYPGFQNTKARLIRQILTSIIYTVGIDWGLALLFGLNFSDYKPNLNENSPWYVFIFCSWFPLLMTALFMSVYESRYFFYEWKKNIQQTEAIAHAHIQTQFEALKKQLDPHFLFNSLNTLASLIDYQNEPAQAYLERLSDVYRYVIETKNKTTVSLRDELAFLDAFIYLLKVRYRDNLSIHQYLSEEAFNQHVPALSLQILVENAIKHNIISKDRPLNIDIKQEADQVVVINNKQIKTSLPISTKIGLQNIIERYQLLNMPSVEILDEEHTFTVKLPLLNPA